MLKLIEFNELKKTKIFFMLSPCEGFFHFILSLFLAFILLIIWAVFFPMNETVSGNVILRPKVSISSIKTLEGGELITKHFSNNSFVNEGDLLFSLDTASFEAQKSYDENQLSELENKINENNILIRVIKNENNIPDISIYPSAMNFLSQKAIYETKIYECETKIQREKEKPVEIQIPITLEDLNLEKEKVINEIKLFENQYYETAINNQKKFETEKKALISSIKSLERSIKNSMAFAPISGVISESIKTNIGDFLLAGSEILKIVPIDEKSLIAEIYINSSDIVKVSLGDSVFIQFPGLPPSKYGRIQSKIISISPDAIINNLGNAIFIAEAEILNPEIIDHHENKIKLMPGITAEAKIQTNKITVLNLILEKLDFI